MMTLHADTDPQDPSDIDDQAQEILPLRHRVGLWCAMVPGCGVLLIVLLVTSTVPLLRSRGRAEPYR